MKLGSDRTRDSDSRARRLPPFRPAGDPPLAQGPAPSEWGTGLKRSRAGRPPAGVFRLASAERSRARPAAGAPRRDVGADSGAGVPRLGCCACGKTVRRPRARPARPARQARSYNAWHALRVPAVRTSPLTPSLALALARSLARALSPYLSVSALRALSRTHLQRRLSAALIYSMLPPCTRPGAPAPCPRPSLAHRFSVFGAPWGTPLGLVVSAGSACRSRDESAQPQRTDCSGPVSVPASGALCRARSLF